MLQKGPGKALLTLMMVSIISLSSSYVASSSVSPPKDTLRLQHFPGIWAETGTGRVLQITNTGVNFYLATRKTCSLQNEYASFREANRDLKQVRGNTRRDRLSGVLSGGTKFLRLHFNRLRQLPEVCVNTPNPASFDPEFIFEHSWHVFNDYYPFFNLYHVDWQQQYTLFRPTVSAQTTKEELFNLLATLLSPLDDGHITLEFEEGELEANFSPALPQGWARHFGALAKIEQEDTDALAIETVADFNYLLHSQYGFAKNAAQQHAFKQWDGNGQELPPLVWGILQGNVGYLQINSMGGNFVREKYSEIVSSSRDRRRINRVMNRAMRDLQHTDAMVVDVRFNGGGFDAVALALANRFADTKRKVFSKQKHRQQSVGQPDSATAVKTTVRTIKPHRKGSYTNPVMLITGPDTASAAEVFTMAMRTLPHVTQIGEATEGALSDSLPVALNAYWSINLSHEIYQDADGNSFEGDGIAPVRTVSVSSPKALGYALFPAIDFALNQLGALQPMTQAAFDAQINDLMSDGFLPGFSVAWLDKKGRLAANAYGYADLEKDIPTTVNTPYKIGSISKTLVGISAAQMLERGIIELDTNLTTMLPLSVDHPYVDSSAMTLRQLVTHTASINDGDAYSCGYYIEEDNSSLAALFTGQACPSPVTTHQAEFLSSYLSQHGRLYSADDNFVNAPLGSRYHYSNIGTALAAEVLANAAATDFESWTENNIFEPLGMHNTHWSNRRFEDQAIQPATRYALDNGELITLPEHALATWADGDLRTSVIDLSTLLLSIVSPEHSGVGRVLSDDGITTLLSPQTDQLSDEGEQGIFWTRDNFMLGHDGGDPGVIANMQYSPELDMGFVLMINVSDLDETGEFVILNKSITLHKLIYQRGLAIKAGY